MRVLPMVLAFGIAMDWVTPRAAWPAGQDLYPAPDGFILQSNNSLYGAMNPYNWKISQWSTPGNLPPFVNGHTANNVAAVQFINGGGFQLAQDGHALPCTYPGSTQPQEFDLFSSPMQTLITVPTIDQISSLYLGGTIAGYNTGPFDNVCQINIAVALVAVILDDAVTNQVFFYQLHFGLYGITGGPSPTNQPGPAWFYTGLYTPSGEQFGYDDYTWTYGMSPLVARAATPYSFDVMPMIKSLIVSGANFGMDQNLANWQIASEYVGDSIWGHVHEGVTWSNVSFQVVTTP